MHCNRWIQVGFGTIILIGTVVFIWWLSGQEHTVTRARCRLPFDAAFQALAFEWLAQPWPDAVYRWQTRWLARQLDVYGFTGVRTFLNAYFQPEHRGRGVFPYAWVRIGESCGHRMAERPGWCLSRWNVRFRDRLRLFQSVLRIAPDDDRTRTWTITIGHKYQCTRSYVYGGPHPGPWCQNIEGIRLQGDWLKRWHRLDDATREWVQREYLRLIRYLQAFGAPVIEIYAEVCWSRRQCGSRWPEQLEGLETLIRTVRTHVPQVRIQINTEPIRTPRGILWDDADARTTWQRLSAQVDVWAIHGMTPDEWPDNSGLFQSILRSGKLEISDEGQFCLKYHPALRVMCRGYCGGELFQRVVRAARAHGHPIRFEHALIDHGDIRLIPAWNLRELEEMQRFCADPNRPWAHIEVLDRTGTVVVPRLAIMHVTWGSVAARSCRVVEGNTIRWHGICGMEFVRAPIRPNVRTTYRLECVPGGTATVTVRTSSAVCGNHRCEHPDGEAHWNCPIDCAREPRAVLYAITDEAARVRHVLWRTRYARDGCRLMLQDPHGRWRVLATCATATECAVGTVPLPNPPTAAAIRRRLYLECRAADSITRVWATDTPIADAGDPARDTIVPGK